MTSILGPQKLDLIPTHNGIVSITKMLEMSENLDKLESIIVFRTEDGKRWIKDGHTTACAIWLAKGYIEEKDVDYEHVTYKEINEPDLEHEWFTPINLLAECVVLDKTIVNSLVQSFLRDSGRDTLEHYLYHYRFLFREPREVYCIEDLIENSLGKKKRIHVPFSKTV